MTDMRRDERITQLIDQHGHKGLCFYLWILEIVAEQMDESDRCEATHSLKHWAKMLGTYGKDLEKITRTLGDLLLIFPTSSGDLLTISCPKLLKIRARQKPIGSKRCHTDIDVDIDVDIEKKKNKEKETQTGFADPLFLEFWGNYPRKQAKEKAVQVWKRLKIKEIEFKKIIETLKRHKESDQWTTEKGKYIPLPATWLNQKRWEDEEIEIIEKQDSLKLWAQEEDRKAGRL